MSDKERILQMVAEGKISVDDGERLLKAIGEKERVPSSHVLSLRPENNRKRGSADGKIIIEIKSVKGENIKVNLPLKLAHWAYRMIPKERLDEVEKEGFNIRETLANISEMIDEMDDDIVNITSSNGDQVRVYVERG
jgi:hypothetical protein